MCTHCESFLISVSASFMAKQVSRKHRVLTKDQVEGRDWRKVTAQSFAETAQCPTFVVKLLHLRVDRWWQVIAHHKVLGLIYNELSFEALNKHRERCR